MTDWFTVLASGSAGNASLLETAGLGLLIDCGLGPRVLAQRLAAVGRSWRSVTAVLLTHTHADHWNRLTLAHLTALRVPLYLHRRHVHELATRSDLKNHDRAGLVREYSEGQVLTLGPGVAVRAIPVPHDSHPTYAFRFDRETAPGHSWALGFASDVGHAAAHLATALAGVSVLAMEYNHDVHMQKTSRRPAVLIRRVLGNHGHLSNEQGAELTAAIAGSSGGSLQHLVQLHLSRECNKPVLAAQVGREALASTAPRARLITASQYHPTVPLPLSPHSDPVVPEGPPSRRSIQPPLPGLEAC